MTKEPLTPEQDTETWKKLHLRANLLIQDHGLPDKQKDTLVKEILRSFESPQNWPMTDSERIELLKTLYQRALFIRDTEQAIAHANVSS